MQDGISLPKYIEKSGVKINTDLKDLREEILDNNFQEVEIQKEAERIYQNWHNKEKIWSMIVLHNELDAIETSLISMKANIETKEYKKSVEEIDKSIFLLRHIYEKEKFCLKNIL